jgi:HSP20 family protein
MELIRCKPNSSIMLFDELFNDLFDVKPVTYQPTYDIVENDNDYQVNLTLAGFKKENINVEIDETTLKITAERKENDSKFNRKETFYGKYYKQFKLSDNIDKDGIKASYVDGMLNILIPKTDAKEKVSRTIEIT